MKQRMNQTNDDYKSRNIDYPIDGITEVYIKGYVQRVKPSHDWDYITFILNDDNDPMGKDGRPKSVGAKIPHKLPQLEVGDHIELNGYINSYTAQDKRVILEIVAFAVAEVK